MHAAVLSQLELNLKPFLIHKPYWLTYSLFAVCDRTSETCSTCRLTRRYPEAPAGSGRHDAAVAFRTFRIAHDTAGTNIRASWKRNPHLVRADHDLRCCDRARWHRACASGGAQSATGAAASRIGDKD